MLKKLYCLTLERLFYHSLTQIVWSVLIFYFILQRRTNWNCSKYQAHKCRSTATTDGENFVQTRVEHNLDKSTGKSDAPLFLKIIKDLSESNTPTVAVATTAIQPITDDLAAQLALATKEKIVRTAQSICKQRKQVLPSYEKFRNIESFRNL